MLSLSILTLGIVFGMCWLWRLFFVAECYSDAGAGGGRYPARMQSGQQSLDAIVSSCLPDQRLCLAPHISNYLIPIRLYLQLQINNKEQNMIRHFRFLLLVIASCLSIMIAEVYVVL